MNQPIFRIPPGTRVLVDRPGSPANGLFGTVMDRPLPPGRDGYWVLLELTRTDTWSHLIPRGCLWVVEPRGGIQEP